MKQTPLKRNLFQGAASRLRLQREQQTAQIHVDQHTRQPPRGHFMKASSACEKLKHFRFLSGFAMLLPWLLLPALAAGQVSSVQVNSSNAVFINRSTVAVPF